MRIDGGVFGPVLGGEKSKRLWSMCVRASGVKGTPFALRPTAALPRMSRETFHGIVANRHKPVQYLWGPCRGLLRLKGASKS
jgi:hypothetical protein